MTLEEAKQYLRDNWELGCRCPCCNQFVKKYKRTITSSMALALIILYKSGDDFIHWGNLIDEKGYSSVVNSGDKSKLVYWGLVEKKPATRYDGSNRNGFYKITLRGELFVKGEIQVSKHVYLYNDYCYGQSETLIDIKQALKNKFNYYELIT